MIDLSGYRRGIRTSIRINATAFGYSILATAAMGVVSERHGSPDGSDLLLFVMGAALAFSALEAAVSGFFRHRVREERSDVVVLGNALNFISIGAALGVAWMASSWAGSTLSWFITPLLSSVAYLLVVGLEMALAIQAQE